MARYSVIIPTRNRPDTLRWSIQTALAMKGDVEVVVQDNAGGADTQAVIDAIDDPRLVRSRTDVPLPMSENWEQALDRCTGEWVHVIGDDDGMMPGACTFMDRLLSQVPEAEVVTWSPHTYWWPDCIVGYNRNRLYVRMPGVTGWQSARRVEQAYFGLRVGWDALPMIYNSFVHRSVIERVRKKAGAYFPTMAPDVFSGMANLWAVDRFVRAGSALSIRGTSRHSIGVAYLYPQLAPAVAQQFTTESIAGRPMHSSLIDSDHTQILLANEQCMAHILLHDERPDYALPVAQLLHNLLAQVNAPAVDYAATLDAAIRLAARHGVALPPDMIPARALRPEPVVTNGLQVDADGKPVLLRIDGELAGLRNILDACRLTAAVDGG